MLRVLGERRKLDQVKNSHKVQKLEPLDMLAKLSAKGPWAVFKKTSVMGAKNLMI